MDPLDQKIDPNYKHLTNDPEVSGLTNLMKQLSIKDTNPIAENTTNISNGLIFKSTTDAETTNSIDTSNISHVAETSLTEDELNIYNRTRIWLQQASLMKNAIERATSNSRRVREKGLAVIRQPLLHNTTLWGDITNLVYTEPQKRRHEYVSFGNVPESFRSEFQLRLSELMSEYELPFPVTDENREEAHEEIRGLGFEI